MLHVAPDWVIPTEDLDFSFVRASGPGGQNVNKLATKVELRLRLEQTTALNAAQKRRLASAFPSHVSQAGEFILTSDRHRSQSLNQRDVSERLAEMLLSVRFPPKRRVATRPSRAAKRRRMAVKRARGEIKRQRGKAAAGQD
jgi:ribosome-associated protein